MNIEKLAKHLKEFILDEIEMIAEIDCTTELEQLLNSNKLSFEQGVYKYMEKEISKFAIFSTVENIDNNLMFEDAVKYFLQEYVIKNCTKRTYDTYFSIFKMNITPFFKNRKINKITVDDIKSFYKNCQDRKIGISRLKNTLTQLNQLIKYYQNQGIIDTKCTFQVRRITQKNEFNLSRITFKENL